MKTSARVWIGREPQGGWSAGATHGGEPGVQKPSRGYDSRVAGPPAKWSILNPELLNYSGFRSYCLSVVVAALVPASDHSLRRTSISRAHRDQPGETAQGVIQNRPLCAIGPHQRKGMFPPVPVSQIFGQARSPDVRCVRAPTLSAAIFDTRHFRSQPAAWKKFQYRLWSYCVVGRVHCTWLADIRPAWRPCRTQN
jgi:hypothetical protein